MITVFYKDIDKKKWDDFVDSSPEAWLYSRSFFIDKMEESSLRNISFALMTDSGEIQSICPLFLYSEYTFSLILLVRFVQKVICKILRMLKLPALFRKNYLSTGYSGIALKSGISKRNKKKNFKQIIKVIDDISAKYKAGYFEVRNVDIAPINDDFLTLYSSLLSAGMHVTSYYPIRLFSRVDLSLDVKQIWSGIDEDCRAEINRAKRENVTILINPDNALERFYNIHCISWNRTAGFHHPLSHFLEEEKAFKSNIYYFIALNDGKDIAAIIIHVYKNSVFYASGCSLSEGQSVKPNNFLLYSAIMWAKEQGLKWFGVGIFDSSCGLNEKEYKVGQYKSQFSTLYHPVSEFKKFYSKKSFLHFQYNLYSSLKR